MGGEGLTGWVRAVVRLLFGVCVAVLASCATHSKPGARGELRYEVFTAGDRGFGVTSTIFYGPREAILIDAQFIPDDAARLADRVTALRRKLSVIFVTHSDADHVGGLAVLRERFPDARIYMTEAALATYRASIEQLRSQYAKSPRPQDAPPLEPIATPLPGTSLTVDGHRLEIIADLQGDVPRAPSNSVVWAPELSVLVAGDLAFDHVHVYLERSTPAVRAAWQAALSRLEAMNAATVVAGHKRDPAATHAPAVLGETRAYIATFDRLVPENKDAAALEAAVRKAYPDWAHPVLVTVSARSMYAAAR